MLFCDVLQSRQRQHPKNIGLRSGSKLDSNVITCAVQCTVIHCNSKQCFLVKLCVDVCTVHWNVPTTNYTLYSTNCTLHTTHCTLPMPFHTYIGDLPAWDCKLWSPVQSSVECAVVQCRGLQCISGKFSAVSYLDRTYIRTYILPTKVLVFLETPHWMPPNNMFY